MSMEDVIIKDAQIITLNKGKDYLQTGSIVIRKNRIYDVNDSRIIEKKYRARRVIDAKNMICLPGLVNGHNHYEQSFFKGITRLFTGNTYEWIRNFKTKLTKHMSAEDYYLSTLLSCLEMIKLGTTCSVNYICQQNPYKLKDFGLENIYKALRASGLRTEIILGLCDVKGMEDDEFFIGTAQAKKLSREIAEHFNRYDNGQLKFGFGPFAIRASSDEMWKATKEMADHYKTVIHTHITGGNDVSRANDLGLLAPNFVAAHCPLLTETDIDLFAKNQVKVVHNPTYILSYSVNWELKNFGDGLAPVIGLLRKGIVVGLGTDGCMGDTQDMFREMRNIAFTQQYKMRNKSILPPTKLLEMSLIDNAKTMLWEKEIGSIEKGKKADLILISKQSISSIPWINLPASLVYLCSGYDVDTTIIDGQILMEKREIKIIDEEYVKIQAQECSLKLLERAGLIGLLEKGFQPWCSDAEFYRDS